MIGSSRVQEIRSAYGVISDVHRPHRPGRSGAGWPGRPCGRSTPSPRRPAPGPTDRAAGAAGPARRRPAASAAWAEMPSTAPSSAVAELRHLRRAVPAEPDQPFTPGQRRLPGSVGEVTTACRSAQCAAARSLATSAGVQGSIGGSRVGQGGVRRPSRPDPALMSNMCSILRVSPPTASRCQLSLVDKRSGHRPPVDSGSRQARPPKVLDHRRVLNHRRTDPAGEGAGSGSTGHPQGTSGYGIRPSSKQVCGAGVAGGTGLVDHEQQRVAVAVAAQLPHLLVWPDVSPLTQYSCRLRLQYVARPGLAGPAYGLGVHPRQHQHLMRGGLLHDDGHQTRSLYAIASSLLGIRPLSAHPLARHASPPTLGV